MDDDELRSIVRMVTRNIKLSSAADTGCRNHPDQAKRSILLGWNAVVWHCLSQDDHWALSNAPSDDCLLREIRKIYATNWSNMRMLRILTSFYRLKDFDWRDFQDIRPQLDLAIHSAIEAWFACLYENSEQE
mgnify:FL=1